MLLLQTILSDSSPWENTDFLVLIYTLLVDRPDTFPEATRATGAHKAEGFDMVIAMSEQQTSILIR